MMAFVSEHQNSMAQRFPNKERYKRFEVLD